uniref:Transposase n=1 Tax=Ditylenchus dipsaci TaxID=166011 RepID=A0A915EW54_9BILA
MKADEVTSKWIDSVPNHPHFCESRKVSEVKGISLRRSMQAEMASGSNQTVSSAIVRIESKILISLADQSAEYVRSFNDLVEDENRLLTHTLRGSVPGSDIMEKDAALWRLYLSNAEEENADDVHRNRQQPRQRSQESARLSSEISIIQTQFLAVVDNQINEENFAEQVTSFLLRMGYLMGYQDPLVPDEEHEMKPIVKARQRKNI